LTKNWLTGTLLLLSVLLCAGSVALAQDVSGVQSVRAVTDVGWWGQRVIGVVLEFTEEVDASNLTPADFKVRDTTFNPYFDTGDFAAPEFMADQKVVDVFTVSDPKDLLDSERPAAPGKYLVVMVEPSFTGGTKMSIKGGMMANPEQPTEVYLAKDIYSTNGTLLAKASPEKLVLTGPAVVNRGIDHFVHGIVENPSVGLPLNYHYRLPANYDPAKKYPLVVFFNGFGQGYFPEADNVGGHLICDGTPLLWFNEQDVTIPEDVIFLAPQSTRPNHAMDVQAEQAAELIRNFAQEFAVDPDRIYGYSLSMGSIIGWHMVTKHSDLFAAFIQTGFFPNNPEQAEAVAAAEVPMWLFQGENDHLLGSDDAVASYERIVEAYKARGLAEERINELINITVFPDEAFEPQGAPDRIDRHAPLVPAFQDPATSQWLLAQKKNAGKLAAAEALEALVEGPTVIEDPQSPTGYTVRFVYKNPTATKVQLAGDLELRDLSDPHQPWPSAGIRYQPEEWQPGRYHVGGNEFRRDMEPVGNGYWTVSVPLHAGGLSYWYRVWDPAQGWEDKRIWDPTSEHVRPAGSTTFRVGNNDVLDVVYVPYHEKQNDPVLKQRAEYELPVQDPTQRGTVRYVEYTNILGDDGWYLGIYLPPGYDHNRPEPYKVMYLAHGIFGDETDFMIPVNAPKIFDNLIAKGEVEPTVLVTMGNHFSPGSGFESYNMETAARNIAEVIIPFMEEHYNVANEREGRAYGGFSMGAMTGGQVLNNYHNLFGYFAFLCGSPREVNYAQIAEEAGGNVPFLFLGNGTFEGPIDSLNEIRDQFREISIPSETASVPGAHDGMTAGQLLTLFAREYLWK
jgi:predicted peptidase